MLKNIWTSPAHSTNSQNNGKWQIGFYEHESMTFCGIFNHIFTDSNHVIGFEESGIFDYEHAEAIMRNVIKNLCNEGEFYHSYFIPNVRWARNWMTKKPETISRLKWAVSSSMKKFNYVLDSELKNDNIRISSKIDKTGHIGVVFDSKEMFDKYFNRLGVDPDNEPDILLCSKNNHGVVDNDLMAKFYFTVSNRHKTFDNFSADDWSKWCSYLDGIEEAIWAVDGHVYVATNKLSKNEIVRRIQSVSDLYSLGLSTEEILF